MGRNGLTTISMQSGWESARAFADDGRLFAGSRIYRLYHNPAVYGREEGSLSSGNLDGVQGRWSGFYKGYLFDKEK